jgi:hypothetical protein
VKKYSSTITLSQTSRGVWGLDTVKGCKYGMQLDKNGCYGACYACSIAKRYGYDFSDSTIRRFTSKSHENQIINIIKAEKPRFLRIGIMGDPSECWGHTIEICDKIRCFIEDIIIVTKHWEKTPAYLHKKIKSLNLIINTSISALDSDELINHRLEQYEILKSYCKSILRVVTCDFNIKNIDGIICDGIQKKLLKNENVINTVFRPGKDNILLKTLVINAVNTNFLGSKTLASIYKQSSFFGYCKHCPDSCGLSF